MLFEESFTTGILMLEVLSFKIKILLRMRVCESYEMLYETVDRGKEHQIAKETARTSTRLQNSPTRNSTYCMIN